MKTYVKKHLREIIWFCFLNKTHIFLSHELFEILYICFKKKKVILDETGLKLMLKKTIFNAMDKDDEGEIKWISKNNKKFRVLIKNDLLFLNNRSDKIIRKWFLISFKQLIKVTYEFYYEEEDIDFFDLIMEIDDEYKKMLLNCSNNRLSLEDEVYSVLNVTTDQYIDDTATLRSYNFTGSSQDVSENNSGTVTPTSEDFWDENWGEDTEIPETVELSNVKNQEADNSTTEIKEKELLSSTNMFLGNHNLADKLKEALKKREEELHNAAIS